MNCHKSCVSQLAHLRWLRKQLWSNSSTLKYITQIFSNSRDQYLLWNPFTHMHRAQNHSSDASSSLCLLSLPRSTQEAMGNMHMCERGLWLPCPFLSSLPQVSCHHLNSAVSFAICGWSQRQRHVFELLYTPFLLGHWNTGTLKDVTELRKRNKTQGKSLLLIWHSLQKNRHKPHWNSGSEAGWCRLYSVSPHSSVLWLTCFHKVLYLLILSLLVRRVSFLPLLV